MIPQEAGDGGRCGSSADHLTARQIEILLLTASGADSTRIARTLKISTYTVNEHLATMLHRADVKNRPELVARSYAAGILLSRCWPPQWSGSRCLVNGSHALDEDCDPSHDP